MQHAADGPAGLELVGSDQEAARLLPNHVLELDGAALQHITGRGLTALLHHVISSNWVEELEATVADDTAFVALVAAVASLAGRPFRVLGWTGPRPPASVAGATWRREAARGTRSWVLRPHRASMACRVVKRCIDLVVAATLLITLWPLFLVVGVSVKASSEGPTLYPWRVLGRNGRPFKGYKFRTMIQDAEQLKGQLTHLNEMSGPVFKITNDPRITPVGAFLRRHSLDELPQLWSVVRGDMSLVGPRPPSAEEYAGFELWQLRKLSVTPGMTCLWQVGGRNHIRDFDEWASLDLEYIDRQSIPLDLNILARTALAVVGGTGK